MTRHLGRLPLLAILALVLAGGAVFAVFPRGEQRSVEAFCRRLSDAEGLDESLAAFDASRVDTQLAALRSAAKVAPTDIAPQVDQLVELSTAIRDTIRHADGDPAAAVTAMLRDRQSDLGAVGDAGAAVERYATANCGVQLNGATAPAS